MMTVAELIEELKEFPQDAECVCHCPYKEVYTKDPFSYYPEDNELVIL